MNIGIAKEIKPFEGRVALSPNACIQLIAKGHTVYIERSAGVMSGYSDEDYLQTGVLLCESAWQLYDSCELIVKVKEPLESEWRYLSAKHTLFCFLHLAANRRLAEQLADIGLTAVAFESVSDNQCLPLLRPMSQIAGKIAVQTGATLLHQQHGGSGVLMGGVSPSAHADIDNAQVLVLGAGSAGTQAALLASNMGANVAVFDRSPMALRALQRLNNKVELIGDAQTCLERVPSTDLLVAALLVPGKQAPHFITRTHIASMRKGSVAVDISVDQGGCIETTRATTYENPTYISEGVIHFCVANMPGAVPRTASQALSLVLPDYIHRLTLTNWFENDKIMQQAVNIKDGKLLINI